MRRQQLLRTAVVVTALAVLGVSAAAQEAVERTTLKISEPLMVPGTTLQPGTYVLELATPTAEEIFQIRNDDGEIVTTMLTVPARRQDARGDIVLKVNPTEGGTPALKAFFYPGSVFGHEFVYPDDQARQIAQRTRTVVLSQDVEGSDLQRAEIYVYDAAGLRQSWTPDPDLTRDWNQWREQQKSAEAPREPVRAETPAGSTAVVTTPASGRETEPESQTAMIAAQSKAVAVDLDDLETNAQRYVGKTVSVDAEVDEVLGPRVFKIDEPSWADLDGEMLVVMPSHLAAMVREDDRVTVTGTVKQFLSADFDREWGFDLTPELEVDLETRPVMEATRIVGGNDNVALIIEARSPDARTSGAEDTDDRADDRAVGTSGETARDGGTSMGLDALADATHSMVGRDVRFENVRVEKLATGGGFWARSGSTSVLVVPASDQHFTAGQTVSLDGVVLRMPRHMREKLDPSGEWNEEVYVYATSIDRQ